MHEIQNLQNVMHKKWLDISPSQVEHIPNESNQSNYMQLHIISYPQQKHRISNVESDHAPFSHRVLSFAMLERVIVKWTLRRAFSYGIRDTCQGKIRKNPREFHRNPFESLRKQSFLQLFCRGTQLHERFKRVDPQTNIGDGRNQE